MKYTIEDTEFEVGFFLADGMYLDFAYFMKTISERATARDNFFAMCQEECIIDVDRAFGRLLSRWYISDYGTFQIVLPNSAKF